MMSRRSCERGFFVVLVVVLLTGSILLLSVILTFAARSYKLEKTRGERARLYFLALSGLNMTVENIIADDEKEFTSLPDIRGFGREFFLENRRVVTTVEDENARINIREVRRNSDPAVSSFAFSETEGILKKAFGREEDEGGTEDRWTPFITNFGSGSINLNTAPQEVLEAFFERKNDVLFFMREREEKPLRNISELSYARQEYFRRDLPLKNLPFTVKSDCFTIYSEASSGRASVRLRAVFLVHDKTAERIYFEKYE